MFRISFVCCDVWVNRAPWSAQRGRPPYLDLVQPRSRRVILVHGAATSPVVWGRVIPLLDDLDVSAPERPRTGDLEAEAAWLAEHAQGHWIAGISGGATLGLTLVGSGPPLAGAILHEPAVGSLFPSLLAPVADAFAAGGTAGLARALYGNSWRHEMVTADDATTARELAMFRGFEPRPPSPMSGRVVVTYGSASPGPRRRAAELLADRLGYRVQEVAGASHFAAWDHPAEFAAVIRATVLAQ